MIIHQELALCPQLSIAENIFLGNEQAAGGLIDWNRTNARAGRAAGPGGGCGSRRSRRSASSAWASSSWWRSPRRCPRRSSC
ncbi:hypothetical protein [Kutzneria kofuensis]|uniref:hypothetical protein n=1 Tax=Kutzneria kofuensis TaxID=103725 RepID=UPI0031ED8B96